MIVPVARVPRWERVAGLAALAVALALALDLLTNKGIGFDLGSYVLGARRFLSGSSMYPDPATYVPGPFDQFVYPPPVILVFVPLALIPFDVARVIWFVLLCAVATVLLLQLLRPLAPRVRPWSAVAYLLFFPLLWDIQLGNVTLLTLFLCITSWHVRAKPRAAGPLAAAGIGVKLLPASLALFFIAERRWRLLAATVVSAIVLVVATWPLVGQDWPTYLQIFAKRLGGAPAGEWNIVPAVFGAGLPRALVLAIPIAAALFGAAAALRGQEERGFRLAIAAAPLASTTVWYPYALLSLPLLLMPTTLTGRRVLGAAAVRAAAWILMVIQMWPEPERYTTSPFVGMLLLLALGSLEVFVGLRSITVPRRPPSYE